MAFKQVAPENFVVSPFQLIGKGCDTGNYPKKDYHTLYVGEVVRILAKD